MADKSSHGLGAISPLPILSATAMAKIGCLTCAASHHQWFESPVTHFRNTRRASTVRVFGKAASQGAGSVLQQTSTLQAIQKSGVIACLRAHSAGLALETACIALDAGISVLEITMTTPEALKVIEELVQKYPSAVIGAGTVLTYKDAKNAELAGAKFLMSPAIVKEILEFSKDGPILYIPGAMTPTEVLNAYAFGAKIVKIYPIALLGGGQYMRALKTPFKHIPLVASHGITMGQDLLILGPIFGIRTKFCQFVNLSFKEERHSIKILSLEEEVLLKCCQNFESRTRGKRVFYVLRKSSI